MLFKGRSLGPLYFHITPPCTLCGGYNHSPKHCFQGEHDINDIMEKMNINGHQHSLVVYIPEGEHLDHTLYSHANATTPTPNSVHKLEYIYISKFSGK